MTRKDKNRIPDRRPRTTWRGRDRIAVAGLVMLVIIIQSFYLIAEARQETGVGFPLDDSWIHLRFAQNMAAGRGFSYNPGEPVAGSTAPLWTLLLVPLHVILKNPHAVIWGVKITGILLFCCAVVAAYLIGKKITGSWPGGMFAGLAVASTNYLNWGAVSGLEIPLYLLITLAIILLNEAGPAEKAKILVPLLLGAGVYSRPECGLLFLFFVADRIANREYAKNKKGVLLDCALFAAALVPYFCFNYLLSGSLFPNTFRIKSQSSSLFAALGKMNLAHLGWLFFKSAPAYLGQALKHLYRANPLLVVGLVTGSVVMVYQRIKSRRRSSLMIVFVSWLYAFGIGAVSPFISADFQNGRYIANQTAAMAILAGLGFYWMGRQAFKRMKKTPAVLAAVVVGGLFACNTAISQAFMIGFNASSVRSINAIHVQLGKWIRDNTPENSVVAVNDVGALAYFSGRRVVDLVGLVTPGIVEYFEKYRDRNLGAYRYVLDRGCDYLVIFPRWFPRMVDTVNFEIVHRVKLRDNTASEWVFMPEAETFAGLALLRLSVRPIESEKVVLKARRVRR